MKNGLFLAFVSLLVSACSINPPENFKFSSEAIQTTPDYSGVVIPWNIAPMNFLIENQGDEYLTVARSTKGPVLKVRGNKVQWHLEEKLTSIPTPLSLQGYILPGIPKKTLLPIR